MIGVKYKTKLGIFDIEEEEIIEFENGLPGFENLRKFSLISRADTEPIKWLISLEDERIALPVIDPWLIVEDYSLNLDNETVKTLENPKADRTLVLAVIDLHSKNVSVNLAAPIIVNLDKAIGVQTIIDDARYTVKHPLSRK